MLEQLSERFSHLTKRLKGEARLTEENIEGALRDVRMALLEADVAIAVVKAFIANVKERALGEEVKGSLTPGQAFIKVVYEELVRLMGEEKKKIDFSHRPTTMLFVGLQGSGKTTTVGKLARYFKENHKKRVLLASADVYRPAAIAQLKLLAQRTAVDFHENNSQDPVVIAKEALSEAKNKGYDALLFDTAGRTTVDEAMMQEAKRLAEILQPQEIFLVVDAMQGQDALKTSQAFAECVALTGAILTKLDGDARGGAALSVRHVTGAPIVFCGISEHLDGLEPFHAERMASRVLGMGDVLSLIETAERHFDKKQAEKMAKKLRAGKGFDLEDMRLQLAEMKKMGGMRSLLEKLPMQMANQADSIDDKAIGRLEGIICSMTPKERAHPQIIKASRKKRIASGAGVSVQEVNRLLRQFEQSQKMMKSLQKKGGLGKMMQLFKSNPPLMK